MAPTLAISPEDRDRALVLTPVSAQAIDRLDRYAGMLLEWQQRMNLIADPRSRPFGRAHLRFVASSLIWRRKPASGWILAQAPASPVSYSLVCLAMFPVRGSILLKVSGKKAQFLKRRSQRHCAPGSVHHVRIEDFAKNCALPCQTLSPRERSPR